MRRLHDGPATDRQHDAEGASRAGLGGIESSRLLRCCHHAAASLPRRDRKKRTQNTAKPVGFIFAKVETPVLPLANRSEQ